MKKLINTVLLLFLIGTVSSCLKSGLDDLEAYNGSFTDAVRQNVSLSNLIAYIDLSTAARIMPLNGAPKLGSPGDFSAKEFKYQVTAADGTKREWTIKITDFVK